MERTQVLEYRQMALSEAILSGTMPKLEALGNGFLESAVRESERFELKREEV